MNTKRTQKDIKLEIENLEKQIDDIKDIRKQRPDIAILEDQVRAMKQSYMQEIESSVTCWRSDIQYLKKELENRKKDGEIYLNERISKWFRQYIGGIDWGYKDPKIVWISPDERFAIITSPGGTAGTGTAMGTGGYYYASSTHWLTEIKEGYAYFGRRTGVAGEASKWLEHEGRLTKEVKEKMIKFAEEQAGYKFK